MTTFAIQTIGDKIVETLYSNRVTSENKRIHTPPLTPPFKFAVFVVFYRLVEHRPTITLQYNLKDMNLRLISTHFSRP